MEKFDAQKFIFGERRFVFKSGKSGGKSQESLLDYSVPEASAEDKKKQEYTQGVMQRSQVERQVFENLKTQNLEKYNEIMGLTTGLDWMLGLLNGLTYENSVPNTLSFTGDTGVVQELALKIHEKFQEEKKKPEFLGKLNKAQRDSGVIKSIAGAGADTGDGYDMMLCLSVYKALWTAEKKFKDLYPGMDKVEAFGKAGVKFSVKFNKGQVEVGEFEGITPEMEASAKEEAKKTEEEKKKADAEKNKSGTAETGKQGGADAQKTSTDNKIMAEALKKSRMGQILQMFLGKPALKPDGTEKKDAEGNTIDGYMDAVTGGGGLCGWFAMMAADMEGIPELKGKSMWGGFVSACKAVGGGLGAGAMAVGTKFETWIKDWQAGDTGTVEAAEGQPGKLTFDQLVANGNKALTFDKDTVLDGDVLQAELGKKSYSGVDVKITNGNKVTFPMPLLKKDVCTVDTATGKETSMTGDGGVSTLEKEGTYRLKCDIKTGTKFYKDTVISLAKLAGQAPSAKPTGGTA